MIRSSIVRALLLGSITFGAACAGRASEAREPEISEELEDLRAQRRRDRIRMRQMEERMARLAAERPAVERPPLPVEKLVPAEPEGEIEVVGVTADGTEIVYVDEAAQPDSVAAPTDLLRDGRRPAPLELPADTGGDSLGTTAAVPKVGQVVKSRPPSAQAREPIPVSPRPRRRLPVATTPASAIAEYQRLVALVRSGDHRRAITGLRRFVARYAESDYADNAQYWLGEAYYDQKKFVEAHREFQRVADRYPGGNKVSDALLKAAYCRLNLGRREAAVALLERLISEHPDSRPAQLAREKLGRLGD